ncbi:MAG: ATP synthase F1 subunit delta [Clostridia bacterium]|nr:ATP synthase F1 subunit delta [Clostridia bacterium]
MTDISREYATALFSLGLEEGKAREYFDALTIACKAFEENPEYIDFLHSPGIPISERTAALEAAFSEHIPENVLSFLQLLCENGHVRSFFECFTEYKKLLDESERVSFAKVASAFPLDDTEKANIKHKLEKISGRSVTLECTVDEKLLGGVAVEMDGKIMDGSIRHRLSEVKDVISR